MNIIDQTPYFDQKTGKISTLNRGLAIIKYGNGWLREIDAQSQIIDVMSKLLDKNYTLLRNVTPPGLEVSYPLILVGPPGVFVMYVTPLTGTYRAKGDLWGTISGNNFRDEKPNLLTRTERMSRALQIYLQHQGQMDLLSMEAILLCSDPSVNVDSLRPIIRVVMRDALERFIISITQSRVALSTETILKIIEHIQNAPKPVEPPPAEIEPSTKTELPEENEPPFLKDEMPVARFNELIHSSAQYQPPAWNNEPGNPPVQEPRLQRGIHWWKGLSKKQWVFLLALLVIWIGLVVVFFFIATKGQVLSIKSLLP